MKVLTLLFTLFLCSVQLSAQAPTVFSNNVNQYLSELDKFMNASKNKDIKATYETFETHLGSGSYTPEEFEKIHIVSNLMLDFNMRANPYFQRFIATLNTIQLTGKKDKYFNQWMDNSINYLKEIKRSKLKSYSSYLDFSIGLFEAKALKKSSSASGLFWVVTTDDYTFHFENDQPYVKLIETDLIGLRKKDSIVINKTSGSYYPLSYTWKGSKGRVDWDRVGQGKEVYCEFNDYKIDTKKTNYTVDTVTFYHPVFFKEAVKGSFQDKVVVNAKGNGAYPQFQSFEKKLNIENIGPKIRYVGGFQLQGANVIGFGDKNTKTKMFFSTLNDELVVRGYADQYTIRRGEQIVAQDVDVSIYFDGDSIYHPSADLKFDIPTRQLTLTRKGSGNSKVFFYNSYQQIEMDVENIGWAIDSDSVEIGQNKVGNISSRPKEAVFESVTYYDEALYRKSQNISTVNPITRIKVLSERDSTRVLDAESVAKFINPKYTISTITKLLLELVEDGFIFYDKENEEVIVKEKTFHYSEASRKKIDYDALRTTSKSFETNSVLDLKEKGLKIAGVNGMVLSDSQYVSIRPDDYKITYGKDRNLSFNGITVAGYSTFFGNDFHFNYNDFKIKSNTIDSLRLGIPSPEGSFDPKTDGKKLKVTEIKTVIEDLEGVLTIDDPENKSGREQLDGYSMFESSGPSYVYYRTAQKGRYTEDKFYFQLNPFELVSLSDFDPESVNFSGKLVSSDIFPEFEEELEIQPDLSLGLRTKTPPEGMPLFLEKGNFVGEIILNNDGLQGKGSLSYLRTTINSDDFLFLPTELFATAEDFNLEEQRAPATEFPKAYGEDVSVNWRPYKDSMYIRAAEKPFELFDGNYTLAGDLILTPGGLYGDGIFDWANAVMVSRSFRFGHHGLTADTSSLRIKNLGKETMAFSTKNVKSEVDFELKMGHFWSNTKEISTTMPYNKYMTSMDEFVWDMDAKTIDFTTQGKEATFLSIHEDQDSLNFTGSKANYNLETNLLKIEDVPFIRTADASVYPKDGKVQIKANAVMDVLENATIIADTSNRYHTINKAFVTILGKDNYTAREGYYEYNVGDYKQEIKFDRINITKVRKGPKKGNLVTVGEGSLLAFNNFYLDEKTFFQGKAKLRADRKSLEFDGFARINSPLMTDSSWFSIKSNIDRNDVIIDYDVPRDLNVNKLYAGIRIQRDTGAIYPLIMSPRRGRKDVSLFDTKGIIKYDKEKDVFNFGDSMKIVANAKRGNLLTFNRVTGKVDTEGKYNLGKNLDYVNIDAAGEAEISFDGQNSAFKMMVGVEMIVPDKLLNIILKDLEANNIDLPDVDYKKNYVRKGLAEFIEDDKRLDKVYTELEKYEKLFLPKNLQKYTFFFGNVAFDWHPERESLVSRKAVGLSYIKDKAINRTIEARIEIRMSRSRDELNIYLTTPSNNFYYLNYQNKVLSVVSSNPTFNDTVMELKKDEYQFKMPDGELYEVKQTGLNAAKFFLKRID